MLLSPYSEAVAMAVIFNVWELVHKPLRAFAMVTTTTCAPHSEKDDRMPALQHDEDEVAMCAHAVKKL